jgi:hypothetical protein
VASRSTNRWMASDRLQDEQFFEGVDDAIDTNRRSDS